VLTRIRAPPQSNLSGPTKIQKPALSQGIRLQRL
jgi:hypothetical protein